MPKNLALKLIAVVDLDKLRLYEAQGLKIIEKIERLDLALHKQQNNKNGQYDIWRHDGSSGFELRVSGKDIELNETSALVANHLDKKINNSSRYKELIVIAGPKLLGHLKQKFSYNIKKIITKEISKDLAHQGMDDIERYAFG